jgi:hypothetical protein
MKKCSVVILALVIWLSVSNTVSAAEPPGCPAVASSADGTTPLLFPADLFARTELFFGSLKPDGSMVSETEFMGFLNDKITPCFPNGLTLLTGLGQFLNSQGVIQQEVSRLLILLYPVQERQDNNGKIEAIREAYKADFQQESVLRADRCCERVGF